MEVIIVYIDDAESTIRRRHFQRIEQVPARTSEVIRCTVKQQAVACPVKLIVPATYALVIPYQQILMLIYHT